MAKGPRVRLKTKLGQISKFRDKQIKRADRATEKTLERFGAIVRQDARKLIGSPVKPAKLKMEIVDGKEQLIATPPVQARPAGKPPRARREGTPDIRKIIYVKDLPKRKVAIGPMAYSGKKYGGLSVPEIHEFGAVVTVKVLKVPTQLTRANVKKRKGQLTQVSSSVVLVESKRGVPMVMKMPKRPFMRPAYDRHKSKATKIWKEYYRASRGRG